MQGLGLGEKQGLGNRNTLQKDCRFEIEIDPEFS